MLQKNQVFFFFYTWLDSLDIAICFCFIYYRPPVKLVLKNFNQITLRKKYMYRALYFMEVRLCRFKR